MLKTKLSPTYKVSRACCVLVALLFMVQGAKAADSYSIDLSHIYYQDGCGREIDYDFSSGTIDGNGVITIPDSAILQRAPGEANTVFLWEPIYNGVENQLGSGFCRMIIPQADVNIPAIPSANITIDGGVSDWALIDPYVLDDNTREDDISVPGSDIEYVKLAYSQDGHKLNILIKVADAVSEEIWYRMFFDHDFDELIAKPGNYQVDFQYSTGSGWDVVTQGWNSEDGWDWYPIDEQGQVAASGMYIEGSLDVNALGLGCRFYFLGRTQSHETYDIYDWFSVREDEQNGFSAIGAYDVVRQQVPYDWQFEVTISDFNNVVQEQYYYDLYISSGRSEIQYENIVTQNHTIIIDGNSSDWSSLEPACIVSEWTYTGAPDANIEAVYTALDQNNVYFMVQTAAPLKDSNVLTVEINFNYKSGQYFGHGPWDDLHINVSIGSETLSASTGDLVPVPLNATVKVGQALEVAIPRAELADEGYFNATFVNTWKADSPPSEGEDPTWADPVISPGLWMSWFTGTYEGTYYDNALMLEADIDSEILGLIAESNEVLLYGYEPSATIVDLKFQVENASSLTVSYRINTGLWQTLFQHTISKGQILGFPGQYPTVGLETGFEGTPAFMADISNDDIVNFNDFAILAAHWLEEECGYSARCQGSDLQQNGIINLADLLLITDHWLWQEPCY